MKDVAENNPNSILTALVPSFLFRYHFPNHEYLVKCQAPITIFHGDYDGVVYYGSSVKLKEHFKPVDTLITLPDVVHNNISSDPVYREQLRQLLNAN